MTATTLTGFNMADDLSLDLGITGDPTFGENGFFPGGISFGKISFGAGGEFGTDNAQSTIEVVNLLLGEGNDGLVINGTLDPAPSVQVTNVFDVTADAGGDGGTIEREGFDWKAIGFLVGQTVTIEGVVGEWTVAAIDDAVTPAGQDPNDNSILVLSGPSLAGVADGLLTITAEDKDVITIGAVVDVIETAAGGIITRTSGSWVTDGFAVGEFISIDEDFNQGEYEIVSISGDGLSMTVVGDQLAPVSDAARHINNIDDGTSLLKDISVDPSYTGGIVTRQDGVKWGDEGYLAGHLVTMVDENGKRDFRIIEISEDGFSLTLEGVALDSQNDVVKSFYVQGVHGGLTVVHGGGNMLVESTGDMNIAEASGAYPAGSIELTRFDGRDWSEDRYQAGQVVQLEGETYTRTVLAIVDTTLTKPANSAMSWGDNSTLVLSAPNMHVGQVAGTTLPEDVADVYSERTLHVAEPALITATSLMNVATSSLTRTTGDWLADGFYVGQKVYISGYAGPFMVEALTGAVMTLQDVALMPQAGVELTVFGYDSTLDGGVRVGGDHIVVNGGAGPDSPLVIYGGPSPDGIC